MKHYRHTLSFVEPVYTFYDNNCFITLAFADDNDVDDNNDKDDDFSRCIGAVA